MWIAKNEAFYYIALWSWKISLFSRADIRTALMSWYSKS